MERTQTTLRFLGDWPWWLGTAAAVALGLTAFFLYRRDTLPRIWWVRALLPTLRALAIALIVLMLSGPVLHHRKVIGELSKLFVFVDSSRSMELTDESMDLGRKILVLQRLGLLREDAVNMELPRAGEALAEAQAIAEKVRGTLALEAADWQAQADTFVQKVSAAHDLYRAAGGEAAQVERLAQDLVAPATALAKRELRKIDDRTRGVQELTQLAEAAARWQREIEKIFRQRISELASGENSAVKTALQKFDALPRAERLQALLLEGSGPTLLAQLAETHDVELLTLRGGRAERLWQPGARGSFTPTTLPKPSGETTDLATALKASAGDRRPEQRAAIVLLTDGQHNDGESPIEAARLLGARQLPAFTVGFGSQVRPRDLAIIKAEVPDSVFFQDRLRGQLVLKDDLPAGQPFTVTVKDGDKVVWEQKFTSEDRQLRRVPLDFPVKDLVEKRAADARIAGVETTGIPLELQVEITGAEGDTQAANNTGSLRFRAVTQRRKILLVDGRPRWETRYLRNLFERDEQWEINEVLAGATAGESGILRSEKPGTFPAASEILAPYDLIIFGEVPRTVWKADELQWIADFVAQRGGAIVFIDGARGRLKEYAETPLAPLFPISWKGAGLRETGMKLTLTERASNLSVFALMSDQAANADLWSSFQPPHWLADITPLPGAETLVEANAGGAKVPAIVYRTYGAGQVLYHAFEDSWRWRYEVADLHHVKYWNQAANWIAELPFAARDKFISLDAGAITYQPGDSADLRVRLRDGEGKPVMNAAVDAVLSRDGQKAATIRLVADDSGGGLYRGRTAALEPGEYEVAIESAAIDARDAKARTQFKVQPRETGELTFLNLNEDLLRQMATASGGQYLREELLDQLPALLAPLSQGRVIETDTALWQSHWWFWTIIALLTIEWIIRKRVGML